MPDEKDPSWLYGRAQEDARSIRLFWFPVLVLIPLIVGLLVAPPSWGAVLAGLAFKVLRFVLVVGGVHLLIFLPYLFHKRWVEWPEPLAKWTFYPLLITLIAASVYIQLVLLRMLDADSRDVIWFGLTELLPGAMTMGVWSDHLPGLVPERARKFEHEKIVAGWAAGRARRKHWVLGPVTWAAGSIGLSFMLLRSPWLLIPAVAFAYGLSISKPWRCEVYGVVTFAIGVTLWLI